MRKSASPPRNPVLVVNDDPEILRVFRKKFEKLGVSYEKAMTGSKALFKAKTEDYSAIFIDLVLSDMDGIELYEKMLESESHYELPVFFIVNTGSKSELEVFNRLSPDKPVAVISRGALETKLSEILPTLVDA